MTHMKPSPQDMDKIIKTGRLVSYILGEDEFSPSTPHPEEDYGRWTAVEQFYNSPDSDSITKQYIKDIILALFDHPSASAKYASVTLCRLLGIREIEGKINQTIQENEFEDLADSVKSGILHTATKMQFDKLADVVVTKMTQAEKLKDFMLWSSTPPNVGFVTGDDLWRMRAVARYYELANNAEKKYIEQTIIYLVVKYSKFRTGFRDFLKSDESGYDNFKIAITKLLQAIEP